jgi:hypothetical protein
MSAISPRVASDLALAAYEVKSELPQSYELTIKRETKEHFNFDLSKNVHKGTSGDSFGDKKRVSL